MPTKNVLYPYPILTDQTLVNSFTSAATNVQFLDRVSYSVTWTTDAVGSLIVQGSGDGVTFADLTMNPLTLNNADDSGVIDIQTSGLHSVRLSYTRTSGTGTMNAKVSAKAS